MHTFRPHGALSNSNFHQTATIFLYHKKSWTDQMQKEAINQLIEASHPKNVRYMREGK